MAGVWSSVLTLDFTIPSNGQLAPGSNTFYIGGPRMPADLKADGALSALIWYSNADGFAAGIDYWYLAHLRVGVQSDLLQVGYKKTGGSRVAIWGGWITASGDQFSTFEAVNDLRLLSTSHDIIETAARAAFIQANYSGVGAIQLIVPNGTVEITPSGGVVGTGISLYVGGTNVYIKARNSTVQDTWLTSSTTQTIAGVANCSVKFDWRVTPDYIVDVRWFISCPSPVGVGLGAVNLALPVSFPAVDLSPGILRGGFAPCVGEGGTGFYPMMMRFNNGGTADLFTNNNPNNNTVFEGGGAFTLAKP